MRRLLQSVGLAVASVVLTLCLLELGVRLFVPKSRWLFLHGAADWKRDSVLGWVNKPGIDVESQTAFGSVHFRTNGDGMIPAEATREKPPGAVRIMFFGDSMMVGRTVDQRLIYTAQLAGLLRERGIAADVVNAGVLGYSTDQALLWMQRTVPLYGPDVVVYGSTLNDHGGNTLSFAYGQSKPRFRLEGGRLSLVLPAPADEIERGGADPRRWLQHLAVYRLVQPGIARLRGKRRGFAEGILLGTEPGLYIDASKIERLDWGLYAALIAKMKDTAGTAGARFLYFAHPELGEVWEPYIEKICSELRVQRSAYDPFALEKRLVALTQQRDIDFMPTIGAFRAAAERGPFHLLPIDAHLNASGHRLLAELLADRLAALLAPAASAGSADSPDAGARDESGIPRKRSPAHSGIAK